MSDKKTDIAITSIKSILGLIPYFGTAINESVFEHRSRVKQKRINDFVQSLSDYIESLNLDNPSTKHISSDDFGDVFETIVRKVSLTSNKEKVNRFKLILANQIINPTIPDFIETYIDLISKLNEIQIQILINHFNNREKLENVEQALRDAENEIQLVKDKENELRIKAENGPLSVDDSFAHNKQRMAKAQLKLIQTKEHSEKIQRFRNCSFYDINEGDFLFFKQDLVAKGLLKDVGVGSIGVGPYQIMDITEFGAGLLRFIKD